MRAKVHWKLLSPKSLEGKRQTKEMRNEASNHRGLRWRNEANLCGAFLQTQSSVGAFFFKLKSTSKLMCSSSLYSRPPRMFPPWLYQFHAMSSSFQCNAFLTRSLFLFEMCCKKHAQNSILASGSSSVRNLSLTTKPLVAQASIIKNHWDAIKVPKATHLSYRLVYEPPFLK